MSASFDSILAELDGRPITSLGGEDGAVYLVQSGHRRWITDPGVLERLGIKKHEVRHISHDVVSRIPKGEPITRNLQHELRFIITAPHVAGRGIELGGGIAPSRMPAGSTLEQFDKRTVTQLAEYFKATKTDFKPTFSLDEVTKRFPEGADFLLAHHVLEHCSNPIGALAQWHSYVRTGGTLVISVPHVEHTPDRGRLVPPLEHVLMDHLLDRGDDTFESREHIYSFLMGWCDDGFARGLPKGELAAKAHECANHSGNDLHWHAYRPALLRGIVECAAVFSGCRAVMKAFGQPETGGDHRTESEIICVYKLERVPGHVAPTVSPETATVLRDVQGKLGGALLALQRATTRGPSLA